MKKPKKRINSRNKGAAAERELANELKSFGFIARRGQQFHGGADSPDVVCQDLSNYHIECKRVESGNLYVWMAQAKRDAKGKTPIVVHRRNGKDWVVILGLRDFISLASEF